MLRATVAATIAGTVSASIPAVAAADEPDELWRLETEDEADGGPTVVDGDVYVTVDDTSQTVYSLDSESGDENWEISGSFSDDDMFGHPHIVDGTLYGGSSEGMVKAFDVENQEEEWTFEPDGDYFPQPPKLAGGTVYVVGSETEESPVLFAVDADDGSELWSHQGSGGNEESPIIAEDTVYYNTTQSVFAVDIDNGEERWSRELGERIARSITVAGGNLYTMYTERTDGGSAQATITALDAETGDDVWSVDSEESATTTPTVYDGRVLAYEGNNLVALDVEDGDEHWRYSVDTGSPVSSGTPTVADGVVYFGAGRNDPFEAFIHAVDADSGDGLWTAEIGDSWIGQPPIVSEGTLYAWVEMEPGELADLADLVALDLDGPGSSEDSRVMQAVYNHHDGWTGDASMISVGVDETEDDGSTADGDDEAEVDDGTEGDESTGDDGMPGFGIAAAVTAVGGAGYALKRRLGDDEGALE